MHLQDDTQQVCWGRREDTVRCTCRIQLALPATGSLWELHLICIPAQLNIRRGP